MKIGKFDTKNTELRFSELDQAYQNHFIKEYALAGAIFVGALLICIAIKQYIYVLGCVAIMLGYCVYLYIQIYKSLANKVLVLDLKCIDINKKESSLLGLKDMSSKTCTITLENEKGLKFTQPVPYANNFKTGDTIRIYANEGTISQLNQNTYTVVNPIFIHVLAS